MRENERVKAHKSPKSKHVDNFIGRYFNQYQIGYHKISVLISY